MFKLVLILMMHQTSGHIMEVSVEGFDTFEACNSKKVSILETATGWGDEPNPVKSPKQILSIHCEKE